MDIGRRSSTIWHFLVLVVNSQNLIVVIRNKKNKDIITLNDIQMVN